MEHTKSLSSTRKARIAAGSIVAAIAVAVGLIAFHNASRAGSTTETNRPVENFVMSAATPASQGLAVVMPFSNISDFKTELHRNYESARSANASSISIPPVRVTFNKYSGKLSEEEAELLNAFAIAFLSTNGNASISDDAYASGEGSSRHNSVISKRRAAAVRDLLVGAGIPAEKITMHAYGNARNDHFAYPSESDYRQAIIYVND